jgi:hypothetical protein
MVLIGRASPICFRARNSWSVSSLGRMMGHLANMVAQFKLATAEFKFRKLEQIAKGRAAFVLYVAICNGR